MSATIQLPRWAADVLASPPRSGAGFHHWLFRAARALWKCGRDENEIAAILENAAAACGRRVPAREVQDAVNNSRKSVLQPVAGRRQGWQTWPPVNREQVEAITGSGNGLVDLWETSPVPIEYNRAYTEQIIDALFPTNPLLCCATTMPPRRRQNARNGEGA